MDMSFSSNCGGGVDAGLWCAAGACLAVGATFIHTYRANSDSDNPAVPATLVSLAALALGIVAYSVLQGL